MSKKLWKWENHFVRHKATLWSQPDFFFGDQFVDSLLWIKFLFQISQAKAVDIFLFKYIYICGCISTPLTHLQNCIPNFLQNGGAWHWLMILFSYKVMLGVYKQVSFYKMECPDGKKKNKKRIYRGPRAYHFKWEMSTGIRKPYPKFYGSELLFIKRWSRKPVRRYPPYLLGGVEFINPMFPSCEIKLSLQSCAFFANNFCRSRPAPAETETLLRRPWKPLYQKNPRFRARKCFQTWIHSFPTALPNYLIMTWLTWWCGWLDDDTSENLWKYM